MERLAASLPETGETGRFRAVDFVAAGGSPAEGAIDAWFEAVSPLPAFAVVPTSAAGLAAWAEALGLPLSDLIAVAEAQTAPERAPVGVLIGDWRRDELTNRLSALGYARIEIGEVRHFSLDLADLSGGLVSIAGEAWINIALAGDRMWVSSDQRELRLVVEAAPPDDPAAARIARHALAAAGDATALEVTGAELLRQECGPVHTGLRAIVAAWHGGAAVGRGTVMYLLGSDANHAELGSTLTARLPELTIGSGAGGGPGTPAPVELGRFDDKFEIEPAALEADAAVTVSPRPGVSMGVVRFFSATGGCDLATLL
jgi:hypothetical protein